MPTPETVMRGAIDTKSDFIFCVPSFVEVRSGNSVSAADIRLIEMKLRLGLVTQRMCGIYRVFRASYVIYSTYTRKPDNRPAYNLRYTAEGRCQKL
jgi:hypothetical protein